MRYHAPTVAVKQETMRRLQAEFGAAAGAKFVDAVQLRNPAIATGGEVQQTLRAVDFAEVDTPVEGHAGGVVIVAQGDLMRAKTQPITSVGEVLIAIRRTPV